MELSELIVAYREDADDEHGFKLYPDAQLARWATEAEQEAALRARLLYDDSSDLTTITTTADAGVVALDPAVFAIDRATFTPSTGGRACALQLVGLDVIRDHYDWESRSATRPYYVAHYERSSLRLWPTPAVIGTLQLGVYRLPRAPLEDMSDEPEIPPEHHRALVDWMLYRGFNKKDSEQYDPQRAAAALDRFEAAFGKRDTANVMRRHRERRSVTTRMV